MTLFPEQVTWGRDISPFSIPTQRQDMTSLMNHLVGQSRVVRFSGDGARENTKVASSCLGIAHERRRQKSLGFGRRILSTSIEHVHYMSTFG